MPDNYDNHDDDWDAPIPHEPKAAKKKAPVNSRIQSTTKMVYRNGELLAVPHKVTRKGGKPVRPAQTQSILVPPGQGALDKKVTSMYGNSFCNSGQYYDPNTARPGQKKPLVPYNPNSQRNRNKMTFPKNRPSNSSTIVFRDGSNQSQKHRFKTSYSNSFTGHTSAQPANFNNQGIQSERVRWLHQMQEK
eukprot:TRINITY_DN5164_c0_g1_i1.p1 TRINITY_DN5164_c0_g1~~TRINITY_DN5164_c0_g1_i1.p1  ORF type:complete len:190 (-),score=42.78 TRINITY_DN5164_c0_g1_i1:246-815(-)